MTAAAASAPRPRIQSLSDLIFGLALSIGAVQLIGSSPKDGLQVLLSLMAFGFSFLILISIWSRYTEIANVVPIETPGMLRLNFALLFFVAIEPYLFYLLAPGLTQTSSLASDVSALYGLDLGGMNFVLAYFAHLLTKGNLVPSDRIVHFKQRRNGLTIVSVVFVISAVPIFWTVSVAGEPLRIILWVLTFVFARLTRSIWK